MIRAERLLRTYRSAVILTVATFVPLLSWWFATIPGFYSPDSMAVVEQVRSGSWSNVHTTAYTAWVFVTSLGGTAWSLVPLAQVAAIGFAITYVGTGLVQRGLRPAVVACVSALVTSLPAVGAFSVTLWKDVPYAAGCVTLCGLLMRVSTPVQCEKFTHPVAIIASVFIASFRWNGFITLLVLALLYVIVRRPHRILFATVSITTAIIGLVGLVLPERLGFVDGAPPIMRSIPPLHDIAVALRDGSFQPNRDQLRVMSEVMPVTDWRSGGRTCETVDELLFESFPNNSPRSYDNAAIRAAELSDVWIHVVRHHPKSVLQTRLCRASGAILPFPISNRESLILWVAGPDDDDVVPPEWGNTLREVAVTIVNESVAQPWPFRSILFRSATWVWALLLLLVASRGRTRYSGILAVSSMVGVAIQTSAALTALAHDARYVMGALIIGQLVVLSTALDAATRWRRPITM